MAKANEFQQEVSKLLRDRFFIATRLDDVAFNRLGGRVVSKKPYDFVGATEDGRFWAAEIKRVKSRRFPTALIAEHQRLALIAASNSECHSWLFINWRTNRAGIAIWIPFEDYCDVEYINISKGVKSVTSEDFDSKWQLKRVTGGWEIPETHPLYKIK